MLEHVDRMQIAVADRAAAAQTYVDLFDAEVVRDDRVKTLAAKRRVVHAGTSEFELLEPDGTGPVQAYLHQWGEGLLAAGFSTFDVKGVAARLKRKHVEHTKEGEQIYIAPDQTPGLRMVISPEIARPMRGRIRYLYEATNLIKDWQSAAEFYADTFGLDRNRFSPINSKAYGYTGTLTLFNPPERLDRIELSQITDDTRPMGRFMTRRGGECLYMCYVETDHLPELVERLQALNIRHTSRAADDPSPDGTFIHPSNFHGVLMGVSRTNLAWSWSGRPELAGAGAKAAEH